MLVVFLLRFAYCVDVNKNIDGGSVVSNQKETIIKATKLKKSFITGDTEQKVFENLDLEIYKDDFTVIMGSSGAGKSTLMYSLSGMDRPTSGEVVWDSKAITSLSDEKLAVFRRKNCGFVFQQIYLLDKMSLMDNVLTASVLSEASKKDSVKYAKELFNLVNIPETIYKKFPSQVSGGEAQRAGIVRAVINKPRIVFADEPTGALNSNNATAVLDVFTKLHNNGQSIIMVTHDKKTALRGNRVLYVKDGKIHGECDLGSYTNESKEREAKLNQFLTEMGW